MKKEIQRIKAQIEAALSHEEAEDGLYFNNLIAVYEEEERQVVEGSQEDVITALEELLEEGKIIEDDSGELSLFKLVIH